MIKQIKHINKALSMELIKQQITILITKGEMNALIAEALANPEIATTIKRAISPLLADSFPQFPEFTQISLSDTAEDGSTMVILKQPRQTAETPIKSMEPLVVNQTTESAEVTTTPEYVEPSTEEV
jgi:hypothetical protein